VGDRASGVWLGLFPVASNGVKSKGVKTYELKNIKVNIEVAYDPALDNAEKNEKTGKSVSVSSGEPLFLVQGIPSLKPGYVKTAGLHSFSADGNFLKYPQVYTLKLGDRVGQVTMTSYKRENGFDAYKISLQSQGHSQIIYDSGEAEVHGEPPSFMWAGDLDGDNKIDLLLDTCSYNASCPTLFLSSKADRGMLVKLVASFLITGC
jgi:hypothetical protein